MKRRDETLVLLGALAIYLIVWSRFRFTCDDAFIAFRAVSQRRLGFGYGLNAPPFRAVEAYPSFVWVVLLDLAWSVFGVEPPRAAQALGLLFGVGSIVMTALLARRVTDRPIAVGLILLAVVTNRTFVTWTSSGLETSLFTFSILAWVYFRTGWMAALLPLVRPDGWIFALATVVIERKRPRRLLPLLVPIAHVVWRKVHYGSWLPRTWFTQAAPGLMESGSMYLMSFVLEYAYWGWLALVLLCALKVPRGTRKELLTHEATPVVIALLVHFAYYTFRLGGDPLEFRIYAHLVPLLAISFFALAHRAGFAVPARARAFGATLVLGLAVPWIHFAVEKPIGRFYPLYGTAWDVTQRWLADHALGQRHHQMKRIVADEERRFPRAPLDRTSTARAIPWSRSRPSATRGGRSHTWPSSIRGSGTRCVCFRTSPIRGTPRAHSRGVSPTTRSAVRKLCAQAFLMSDHIGEFAIAV